ncbi:unnamed protein product [Ambrosiozyma monospora]|uniref:Unnamed protein product n=1 Tax=Ambrosiozyma monospora TaxID=43982 RepID=A0ACB5T0D7_AMBMO|nr:unnamed protein product [Ambrosiozyma monospora]
MESIRVDATLLSQFKHKTVRILGQLESVDPSTQTAILKCNGPITIKYQGNFQELSAQVGKFIEVIGMIDSGDLSCKVMQVIPMGDNVNLNAVVKLVQLCHVYPQLFYTV